MNRHQRTWAALILGILAGYAVLGLLFTAENKRDIMIVIALLLASSGLWFTLRAQRRCPHQNDKR